MTARLAPWIAGAVLLAIAPPARAAVTPAPLYTYESNVAGRLLGFSVSTAGDVNGDGFSDLVAMGSGPGSEPYFHLFLGGATGFTPAGGYPRIIFGPGHVIVNAAGDLNGDGFDDVVVGSSGSSSGQIKVFYGNASGLDTTSTFTVSSSVHTYGQAVGAAGDVNGDGYADLIVGAPEAEGTGAACSGGSFLGVGRVDVYYGSASGLNASNVWTLLGCMWTNTGGQLGAGVGTAGDVNGDGFDDIVVGAPLDRSSGPIRGAIWVIYGSASGLPVGANGFGTLTGASKRQPGTDPTGFGFTVITAGDVDGDGYADVAAGASGDDTFGADAGLVRVYRGGSTGLTGGEYWTLHGSAPGAFLGAWLAPAGDVNGDGLPDLLVGEANQVLIAQSSGTATPSMLPPIAVVSTQRGIATAGDLDGDGLSEVVIGDGAYTNGEASEGRIAVFAGRGDGPEATPVWAPETALDNPNFGWSVASAGDVNGDGIDDVLVGAPTFVNGADADAGVALLYFGSSSGLGGIGWAAFGSAGDQLGIAVSAAGDVNGDGFADIVVGAHQSGVGLGKALVWYGHPTGPGVAPDVTLTGLTAGSQFGAAVGWGDVNGDGYTDVVVGAPYDDPPGPSIPKTDGGRAFAYLGGPGGLSTSPAWSGGGTIVGGHFGASLSASGDVNGDGFSDL